MPRYLKPGMGGQTLTPTKEGQDLGLIPDAGICYTVTRQYRLFADSSDRLWQFPIQ